MRSFQKFLGIILLSIFIFSACNENISDPQPVSNDRKSLAKKQPSDFVNLGYALNGNNGQGSIFLEPTTYGFGVFIEKDLVFELVELFPGFFINFVVGGQIAFFDAAFGPNDFWRQNPNGSLSVKLNSNQAYAGVYDFGTREYYEGTGHLNTKFTGSVEEFCYDPCIPDPCDPPIEWCFTNLTTDPNINAHVGNGVANVIDSQGGSHQLRILFVQNPGGKGHLEFTLN
jgi:hypothetical protein